jgi:hypothetical protein
MMSHEYETDCREAVHARLFERARVLYVDSELLPAYIGCRPMFGAGRAASGTWTLRTFPEVGLQGLRVLDADMLPRDAPLETVCPADKPGDPTCARAKETGSCRADGPRLVRCSLPAAERRQLLGG